jgi:hypothetical protein
MEDSDRSFWEGINVEGMVTDWIADNAAEFHNESPTLKRRRASKQPKIDYWKTKWGQLLLTDQICNPTSAAAKKFRRRFRVPYPVFHKIIVPVLYPDLRQVSQCPTICFRPDRDEDYDDL